MVRTADGIAVNAETMGERSNAWQKRTWSESGGPDKKDELRCHLLMDRNLAILVDVNVHDASHKSERRSRAHGAGTDCDSSETVTPRLFCKGTRMASV